MSEAMEVDLPSHPTSSTSSKKKSSSLLTSTSTLPWTERYRPSSLSELISHEDILSTLQRFINDGRLPHLLLYGPPGTGKTSSILAAATALLGDARNANVLELNASDDRGINVVRGQILNFASTRNIFQMNKMVANKQEREEESDKERTRPSSCPFKLIILDEADAMTSDAQNALRRIMEKFTEHVRFCLIANYLGKIIPALQSRCTRFRFGPLHYEHIRPRLDHVVKEEKVDITEGAKKALITLAKGDMRKVLNVLQSCAIAFDNKVEEDDVYTCVGQPRKSDVANIIEWVLSKDFSIAYKKICGLKTDRGLSLQDILTHAHVFVQRLNIEPKVKMRLIMKLADIETRLFNGASEKIQLGAFVAAFREVKKLKPHDEEQA